MSEMKYIVYERLYMLYAILFPDIVSHIDVSKFILGKSLSAGFFRCSREEVTCFGESTSMGLKSDAYRDQKVISMELTGMTYLRLRKDGN